MTLKVLDLFAGAGGFTLAGEMAGGYETVAFCEIDKYAQRVLRARWPEVPLFDDVCKLRGSDVGAVDVITGGFPCQDLSRAGRGAGIGEGTRSGLFREMLRIACEVRTIKGELPYILFENVRGLLSGPEEAPGKWFGEFLKCLAEVGYDAEWICVTAASMGAPHKRERVCVVAYPECKGLQGSFTKKWVSCSEKKAFPFPCNGSSDEWLRMAEDTATVRDGNGVPLKPYRDRVKLMGNAIVPPVFAMVMKALRETHEEGFRQ